MSYRTLFLIHLFCIHCARIELEWTQYLGILFTIDFLDITGKSLTRRPPSSSGSIIWDQEISFVPSHIYWQANFLTFFIMETGMEIPCVQQVYLPAMNHMIQLTNQILPLQERRHLPLHLENRFSIGWINFQYWLVCIKLYTLVYSVFLARLVCFLKLAFLFHFHINENLQFTKQDFNVLSISFNSDTLQDF